MTLSLRMKTLSGAYIQNKLRYSLLVANNHKPSHKTRTTSLIINASTTKMSCCRLAISNWTVVRLCVLLVLFSWTSIVSSSSMEVDEPDLLTSKEVVESLNRIGFWWDEFTPRIEVISHSPERTSPNPAHPSSTQNQAPMYAISFSTHPNFIRSGTPMYKTRFSGWCISYSVPKKPILLKKALDEIRRIAVVEAQQISIFYTVVDVSSHKECLLLLCRVLNLVECEKAELLVSLSHKSRTISFLPGVSDNFDLDMHRQAAEDAIKWASTAPFHLVMQLRIDSHVFLTYIFNGLVILRPVSQITIYNEYLPDISKYLERLNLTADSAVIIDHIMPHVTVDVKFVQEAAHKCAKVIFALDKNGGIKTLTGFKKPSATSPAIMISAPWPDIQDTAMHNKSSAHLHGLIYNDWHHREWIQGLVKINKSESCPSPLIFVDNLIVVLVTSHLCDFLAFHKKAFFVDSFAKCGISIGNVEVEYAAGREDFFQGLETLYEAEALLKDPADLVDKNIVCLGHALSDTSWELKEPVHIRLDGSRFTPICSHIRYTKLTVSGDIKPKPGQSGLCNGFLNMIRSINAQELCILNVRNCPSIGTNFDMAKLKSEIDRPLRFNINVGTLILDNVDDCILYRMLGYYEFTNSKPTEIHLLNQRFTSLAIAQILALPMAEKISKIVIDSISRLNEVKYFHERKELNEFSLFNYLKKRKRTETTQKLDLHKLVLIPEPIIFDSYNIPLQALKDLGVQILTPPDKYNTDPPFPNQPHMIDMQKLIYCTITLDVLKADLFKCHATPFAQPNLPPNTIQLDSITNMFLRISDAHFLTRTDLNTIVCRLRCRFKNLAILWLANFKLIEEVRRLGSYKFMANNLPHLQLIQIEDIMPNKGSIELELQPYLDSMHTINRCPKAIFTAISYILLSQLYTRCDKIEDYIPDYKDINPTFQTIITSLQELKRTGKIPGCSRCRRTLYMPPEDIETNLAVIAERERQVDPDVNTKMICYLNCGLPLCIFCAESTYQKRLDHCVSCRYLNRSKPVFNRLIKTPSPIFIFPDSSANVTITDPGRLQTIPWKDNLYYFYLSYEDPGVLRDADEKDRLKHIYHTECRETEYFNAPD
ncbi:hypothetical protein NEHOM01_1736 [Nematocida homosporus]|uniref:uncharacterized protein n=1 Tax=Nematocida homosporus TaxID=1912981 RepID=UPI00221E4396|nr:uncharacterized protein NEHOM01_1736 [Nematocida homosporus]KAI5186835.1 hypothetical protein NEHOM01_1736 [Nematocida homosporus]